MNRRSKQRLGRATAVLASTLCLTAALATPSALARASDADATPSAQLPWQNTALPPERRADLLIAAMTLDQKIEQLATTPGPIAEVPECGYGARHINGIPDLGIPSFRITNGPVGIAQGDCTPQDKATALPDALALSATFDPGLAHTWGDVAAREARTLGLQELESPAMNLTRVAQGGRNFEYLGEDPYLSGSIAVGEIRGIQSNGVIAMAKHFVANDQETNRGTIDARVDDRTLHELYLLPFEMSVKDGDVASIMCAYPRVNGTYNCENGQLLGDVLRKQWGFKGYVQSDWGSMHSTVGSMDAGTDLEFPEADYYDAANIKAALADGSITMGQIDQALRRRYVAMFRLGIFDRPVTHSELSAAQATADSATARRIGDQSAVLLKNDSQTLPLQPGRIHRIALIGQSAVTSTAVLGGEGSAMSAQVDPTTRVTPLQGLQDGLRRAGSSATVDQVIVKDDNSNLADAEAAAAKADVTIVMAGVITAEGTDRPGIALPNDQDTLVSKIAATNPHTVVVLKDADPVLMPWINQVPAVLEAWNPGQEDGDIVADLLLGRANPAGRLPVTYPRTADQVPASTPEQFPGVDVDGVPTATYSEGLDMGYRWYDDHGVSPLFPFGYGLSYTTFSMARLTVQAGQSPGRTPIRITVDVTNTGRVAGTETPQVYLGLPASAGEPTKRLVAFTKVKLRPGQTKRVHLTVAPAATNHPLSVWDSTQQRWSVPAGTFTIMAGDSSAHLPLRSRLTVR